MHVAGVPETHITLAAAAAETTVKQIEDAFKDFTNREGIAIVMISQFVSLHGAPCCSVRHFNL